MDPRTTSADRDPRTPYKITLLNSIIVYSTNKGIAKLSTLVEEFAKL